MVSGEPPTGERIGHAAPCRFARSAEVMARIRARLQLDIAEHRVPSAIVTPYASAQCFRFFCPGFASQFQSACGFPLKRRDTIEPLADQITPRAKEKRTRWNTTSLAITVVQRGMDAGPMVWETSHSHAVADEGCGSDCAPRFNAVLGLRLPLSAADRRRAPGCLPS